jgi:HYR domain
MRSRSLSIVRRLQYISLGIAVAAMGITITATAVTADTTLANWGQQGPAQAPAGRAYAAMAYDSRRGRAVLFGGGSGCCNQPSDTWEWDGSKWSTSFTSVFPSPSISPGMAYDSARDVTVLFDNTGSTWEWNGSSWVKRATATSPPARFWTSMAFDSARGRIVLFGGSASGGVELGDTWTYDGTNWTKMAPANSPSPRFGMAMSFDSDRGVLVLFGGRAAGQRMNDTWEWDGTNWIQRSPTTLPFPRFWHSMAYDAQLGLTVMFGGDHIEPFGLGPMNDTWLWDGTNWTRDWTSATPTYRAGQAMAYESATGRIVLFGGTDELNPGTFYNDTWEFGTGIVTPPGNPALVLPATQVSFGSHPIGITTTASRLRFFGGGTGPLLISSISATGDFAVSASDCPISPNPLAVGAFCSVQMTYTPTVCGTRTGSLIFTDNSATGSESVSLEGGVLSPGCDGDLELIASSDVTANATSPTGAVINYNKLFVVDEESTPPPITCSPALNSTFPIGTTTVTCQVTDSDDVTSTVTATFHVTVNDTDLALAGVPADVTVAAAGPSGTVVNYQAPSVVDEDPNAAPVSCSPASGSTFPIGTTTVTCTVSDTDDTPGSVTATFRVIVGDGDLALSGVPADVTVQATFSGGAAVGYVMPKAVDEDASVAAVTCDHGSGSTFPLGTTTVTCTTTDTDDTPSTVTATFQVTVIDTDLGMSGVPADITINAAGPSGTTVRYTAPTGVDEDGGAIAVSCDLASGSIFPIGTTTVTCSVSDSDDTPSTRTATFRVTINDTDLALTAAPADITVVATGSTGATVTYTPPSAIDEDASLSSVTCNRPSGSTFSVGTTTVTCSLNDGDDTPAIVAESFHVTVIPDLQLAMSVAPATASAHSTVTTATSVTNLGAVSKKVTISYSITYTDSSGKTSVVASDKATVTIAPGQTVSRSFSFLVKNSTPGGTYLVTATASDDTGPVSQSGTFNVT